MNPAAALLAPFLLLLPSLAAHPDARGEKDERFGAEAALTSGPVSRPALDEAGPWESLTSSYRPADGEQVRIEQHVTIRIGPRPAPMPMSSAMFEDDFDGGSVRFVERKIGKCVAVAGVAGVQPAPGNRLLLIMRDRRLVTASLKKGCNSRDFYSGFIVAASEDGMICTGRDQLRSRSGTNCRVEGFRQLVQAGD